MLCKEVAINIEITQREDVRITIIGKKDMSGKRYIMNILHVTLLWDCFRYNVFVDMEDNDRQILSSCAQLTAERDRKLLLLKIVYVTGSYKNILFMWYCYYYSLRCYFVRSHFTS